MFLYLIYIFLIGYSCKSQFVNVYILQLFCLLTKTGCPICSDKLPFSELHTQVTSEHQLDVSNVAKIHIRFERSCITYKSLSSSTSAACEIRFYNKQVYLLNIKHLQSFHIFCSIQFILHLLKK